MKKLILIYFLLISGFAASAADVVELKLPKSDVVVVKLMFRNGSMSDPKGKEGLTSLTASCISEGGTQKLSSTQISETIYPWAASYGVSVDKEVTSLALEVAARLNATVVETKGKTFTLYRQYVKAPKIKFPL